MASEPVRHPMTADQPGAARMAAATDGRVPRTARRQRAALSQDIHLFERAIAAPAGDPGWRPRVSARLGGLRGAFFEHMVVTEGPEGLYAELLDHAPRLARGVHVLIREHAVVAAAMSALQRRVELPEVPIDELRRWAGDLLRELSRHRQRGADLVYQAYQTDIGGET
ncbi:hypothetical protein GCM10027290_08020 [Micromonospora sonneratiae]|uniref:Hemerythrin HHE cation binding domain-containing protein n=1 Tax=Micromonospora sonneratiae TaxID=1184706 RepID=A0ABW3YDW9_9ACTN